jgi:hypothetical protein
MGEHVTDAPGWRTTLYAERDEVHIVPERDVLEHREDGNGCICGPYIEFQFNATRAVKIVTHHSADGRENHER